MKKILPTRRRIALRRVVLAAAVVLLVNRIFLIGLLFPIQAIRQNEEREGTGRTAVVCRDWAREIGWSHLVYLTENEQVTLLSGAQLSPYGWMSAFGAAAEASGPLSGGWWSLGRGTGDCLYYVFGCIDDPDIARLEVRAEYEDWETGRAIRRTAFVWNTGRETWMEKEGRRYFLFRTHPVYWSDYPSPLYPVAIGCDEAGTEIARAELETGAYASFG